MDLKLLVIRSANPPELATFYSRLGLSFDYHQHENSPWHYSTTIGPTVLEIYPLMKTQEKADNTLRLGFTITNFGQVIRDLSDTNVKFHSQPIQTEWGFMAIIEDPEGRRIELYKKS